MLFIGSVGKSNKYLFLGQEVSLHPAAKEIIMSASPL